MKFFKTIWNKIKNPHGIYLALFYIFFAILVALTLTLVILRPNQTVIHYFLYFMSATSLSYFVYTIVIFAPKIKSSIITFLKNHKFTNALLSDFGYRTLIFSSFTLILNLSYVVFMGILGIISKSYWYISITAYYLVLSLIKSAIFHSKSKLKNTLSPFKTYRACGIMFIFLTIALSGIIVLIYTSNMYFEYAGLMIYVVATYTFYNLIFSIVNIFKAKKYENFYIQGIKNVNLASALVSIVVLQVAMFQAFSPQNNTSFANALTGAGISVIILTIGIYMIVRANKEIKLIRSRDIVLSNQQPDIVNNINTSTDKINKTPNNKHKDAEQ